MLSSPSPAPMPNGCPLFSNKVLSGGPLIPVASGGGLDREKGKGGGGQRVCAPAGRQN